ncbi:sulfatase [Maribacter polysaccharolyticus]|uniref:sulfatase n=1 Tax=Maribacter polysaccharolyticus TaxID=3020831 RepID=UPI00237F0B5E|nr:sulfatase [Maribacter polysaccharolyticus]MDE3741024.1 sulfatase [Maribacter polysaccharolyticus]
MKIKQRGLLYGIAFTALLSGFGCQPEAKKTAEAEEQERPNILFIPIDDLRPDLGCYGDENILSPNIDKLAANGVVFNRAYCQQAVCTASRTSLLTGLRPDSTQIWDLKTHFRDNLPDLVSLPQFFKNNGYYSVGLGKTFHNTLQDSLAWNEYVHVDGFPFDPDAVYVNQENIIEQKELELQLLKDGKAKFDKYGFIYTKTQSHEMGNAGDDAYYDGAQTTMAIKKLRELKNKKEPFFLSVGYYKPHLPFNAPKKYWDLYDRENIPLAPNQFPPKNSPAFAVHGDAELRGYVDAKDNLPTPTQGTWDEAKQRELKHAYYACVSYIDAQVGRLMDELDRLGLKDNTIVVLWGDHGWKLGEHNGWAKQTNYEIDTRVPMIISGDKVNAKGKTSNALTEFVDIYPTLCDITGFKVPEYLDGESLKPLLENPDTKVKDAAYSQFLLGRYGPPENRKVERMGYTVRTDRYRYVEWYTWMKDEKTKGELIGRELFDHENDSQENNNIANDPGNKELVGHLSDELKKGFAF